MCAYVFFNVHFFIYAHTNKWMETDLMKCMGHIPPKTRKKEVYIYDIIILSSHYYTLDSPYCKKIIINNYELNNSSSCIIIFNAMSAS